MFVCARVVMVVFVIVACMCGSGGGGWAVYLCVVIVGVVFGGVHVLWMN